MANTDVINVIVSMAANYFQYMMPIIGTLGGIVFIASWLHATVFGLGSRSFRG